MTGESPSSIALSSVLAEAAPALDTLSRRGAPVANGDVWVGEPDSPSVEMDMRRPCCWALAAAAVAMGPGKPEVVFALVGERPNRLVNACPGEKDARRSRSRVVGMAGVEEFVLSDDMASPETKMRGRRSGGGNDFA